MLKASALAILSAGTLFASAVSAVTPIPASITANQAGILRKPCDPPGISNSLLGTTAILTDICTDGTVAGKSNNQAIQEDTKAPAVDASSDSNDQSGANCEWYTLDATQASTRWGENSPTDSHIEGLRCYPKVLDLTKEGGGGGSALVETRFVANAGVVAPQPPPPDPAVLAERAYSELRVPSPKIGAGPERTKLAVNLWTWLWIDDPGPLTNTVAAGGVSVTVIATLSSVTWSLGEPASTGNGYSPGPAVTLTCAGTGTPPPPNYDWKAEPPCGHMFHWRSLKERTNGTGTWPITATSTWNVTWQANTGATGATTLSATGNDAFDIAEYRIVLVGPGG